MWLDDVERAGQLDPLLAPYAGELLVAGQAGLVYDSADSLRGDLLRMLGRHDEAVACGDAAAELCELARCVPAAVKNGHQFALSLVVRGPPGDDERPVASPRRAWRSPHLLVSSPMFGALTRSSKCSPSSRRASAGRARTARTRRTGMRSQSGHNRSQHPRSQAAHQRKISSKPAPRGRVLQKRHWATLDRTPRVSGELSGAGRSGRTRPRSAGGSPRGAALASGALGAQAAMVAAWWPSCSCTPRSSMR
jgi:hypothetical protein